MANRVLMELVSREHDTQVAMVDYQVYALALIHGIDSKAIDKKMSALHGLRQTFVDTLTQAAYDYRARRRKQAEEKRKLEERAQLMDKLSSLGGSGR